MLPRKETKNKLGKMSQEHKANYAEMLEFKPAFPIIPTSTYVKNNQYFNNLNTYKI